MPAIPAPHQSSQDFQPLSSLSDGYHTFAELYEHRHLLMLALMQAHREQAWFSLRHSGGELPFGSENWFIAGIDFGPGLQITYHLPARLWAVAQDTGAAMLDCGRQWDGHTSTDAPLRLERQIAMQCPAAEV